jgi:DNA-binding response OmpR family regulator
MDMKTKLESKKDLITVLIAEDSPTQAEQLKYILEKSSYKVITAKDGKEAYDMVIKHKPSLIISDIMMPEMNGYELCQKIKSNDSSANTPVILLTSLANADDVLEGLACGADNFITKPYNNDYLLTQIDRILSNIKFKNYESVRVGVEISLGGKIRFITADQQQMLSLLISTYDAAVQRNNELIHTQEELRTINENLEELVDERTAELRKEIEIRKQTETELLKAKEKLKKATV